MDLFDPSLTDEPVTEDFEDLDELLSASALLDNKKSNGTNQNHQNGNSKTPKTTKRIFPNTHKLPPRSKTTLDLSTHYTCPASSAEMANLVIFLTSKVLIFSVILFTVSFFETAFLTHSSQSHISPAGKLPLLNSIHI